MADSNATTATANAFSWTVLAELEIRTTLYFLYNKPYKYYNKSLPIFETYFIKILDLLLKFFITFE